MIKITLATYTLLLVSTWAFADVLANPRDQYLEPRFQPQYQQPPPAPQGNVTDMLFNIFLEQGILGAMLIVLGVYFYKMEGQARQDRLKLQEKFESLVTRNQDNLIEVKTHLASLDARMQNLERETEGMKDFIFTRFKV
tara:strand:- start:458 stop:874 length:417 start_codon:yes stop_codon:yes gene_type:complete